MRLSPVTQQSAAVTRKARVCPLSYSDSLSAAGFGSVSSWPSAVLARSCDYVHERQSWQAEAWQPLAV